SAAANETGEERSASVTISWGDGQTRTFTVAQAAIFMDFVSDAEGNPIKWEETFGLYSSESDAKNETNAVKTYTNVFTIALSDDFNKGTYKISNMFYAERYNDANLQPVSNKGGEYYAYYEKGVLSIKMANSVKSYGSMPDVKLKYDAVEKTFAPYYDSESDSRAISAYNYADYRTYYIGGYSAAVKVEEEGGEVGDGFDITSLYGVYNENFTVIQYQTPSPETTEISESDNNSYDIKIKFFYTSGDFSSAYDTAYGKVNASGTEITVTYLSYSNFMSTPDPFVLTVSEGTLSGSVGAVTDYKATKKVSIAGTYAAAWKYASGETPGSAAYSGNFDFTIKEESSDKGDYLLEGMFPYYGKTGKYYAKINGDKLTILANNSSHENAGALQNDIVMTVSGTEITFSTGSEKFVEFGEYMAYMNDFSATMKK
ncbi:MAG: hypothetical protein IKV75_01425, partial [Bacteroidales bacterium]|nr:hypothetical protein [Bacteroidales bacterium]